MLLEIIERAKNNDNDAILEIINRDVIGIS